MLFLTSIVQVLLPISNIFVESIYIYKLYPRIGIVSSRTKKWRYVFLHYTYFYIIRIINVFTCIYTWFYQKNTKNTHITESNPSMFWFQQNFIFQIFDLIVFHYDYDVISYGIEFCRFIFETLNVLRMYLSKNIPLTSSIVWCPFKIVS